MDFETKVELIKQAGLEDILGQILLGNPWHRENETLQNQEMIARVLGGLSGTSSGAALGMAGGPLAPLTVPMGAVAGGFLGSRVGGASGALGTTIANYLGSYLPRQNSDILRPREGAGRV